VGYGFPRWRNAADLSSEWNAICRELKMREEVASVPTPNIVETSFCIRFPAKSFGNEHFLGRDMGLDFDAIGTYDNIHCALGNGMCQRCERSELQHAKKQRKRWVILRFIEQIGIKLVSASREFVAFDARCTDLSQNLYWVAASFSIFLSTTDAVKWKHPICLVEVLGISG